MRLRINYCRRGGNPRQKKAGKMQEALKSFKQYLAVNNLKLTRQRMLIFKYFMSDVAHLSPEELFKGVQGLDRTISRSTVYRTVKHLHNAGIARCIHRSDGVTYYEPMGDQSCQMICERCGRTIPVKNPYLECLLFETARQQGFSLFRYQSALYGLCQHCAECIGDPAMPGMKNDKRRKRP